jgi:hypothetical protein
MGLILLRFALAVWFGGGLATLFATRSIFAVAETRQQGGRFSGAVLSSFLWLRWAAAALTAAAAWLIVRGAPIWWASAAALLTLVHALLDARIRAFRDQLGGSIEGLDALDPRRKRWGALHGASVLLLLAQIACAGAGLAAQ